VGGFGLLVSAMANALHQFPGSPSHRITGYLIGLVFAWSGTAKVKRPELVALAMVDFGVVRRPRVAYAWSLIVVELFLAAALITFPVGWLPLLVAGLLFWAFTLLIGVALARGASFPCSCFGESETILSWRSLVRSCLLALATTGALAASLQAHGTLPWSFQLSEPVVAASLLGSASLIRWIPKLVKWNNDPYAIGVVTR
jgi:Methylamine utilisation protein MauE